MDFFAHQDKARQKTLLLVFYFISALVLIIAALYISIATVFVWNKIPFGVIEGTIFSPYLLLIVSACTCLIIVVGSFYKIHQLALGGEVVAVMMGGQLVNQQTQDPLERKLINVVEEMAIASGTPVPPAYILQEEGINAFAAGYTTSDAIVAVTRGSLETLTRDELQGVIAHEFSHILNGDMRLNIKIMGIVHGLLVLSMIGYHILRSSGRSSRRSSSSKKDGTAVIYLIAFILMVIGYIGVIFGSLIKSAISRQREFLADASSVQFTRNPEGIGGALKKIGGYSSESYIENTQAKVVSHFFFANALRQNLSFTRLMSTHPPLLDRIRRILPSFDGDYPLVKKLPSAAEKREAQVKGVSAGEAVFEVKQSAGITKEPVFDVHMQAGDITATIGSPQAQHIITAAALMAAIPEIFTATAREPFGARAVVLALLLDKKEDVRRKQLGILREKTDTVVMSEVNKLSSFLPQIRPEIRLPVIELAIPAIKSLSRDQYGTFKRNITSLIEADNRIDTFEFMLQRLIRHHCDPLFEGTIRRGSVGFGTVSRALTDCVNLLSVLAWQGSGDDDDKAERAFRSAVAELQLGGQEVNLLSRKVIGVKYLHATLNTLERAAPKVKKKIMNACTACVIADRYVTVEEIELLRAIGDSLDCPIPPLRFGRMSQTQTVNAA